MHKPNICSSSSDTFMNDTKSIHLSCWTKDETYESLLINERSEGKYIEILTYNDMVKKFTYEEIDLKWEIVNIYQKPQALNNYLIDTFSKGDWVLDLFLRLGNIYDITYETSVINIYRYYIFFLIYVSLCYLILFFLCMWWLGTWITCSLRKGINCISIDNDPL